MNFLRMTTALIVFSVASFAFQAEAPKRLEELKNRLNLSAEQVEKIEPILLDGAAKVKEIREKHEGNTASRRSKLSMARELQAVQADIQKRVEPILTKEQREEWNKIRDERKDQLKDLRGTLN